MWMYLRRKRVVGSLMAIVVACGIVAAVLKGRPWDHRRTILGSGTKIATDDDAIPAKVIRPKRDSAFAITIQQIATVEPFFQANLRARASGSVRLVQKDIGDAVHRGELLVEIDEPDLVKDVAQKEAVIIQRQNEVVMAIGAVRSAEELLDVARAAVEQRRADVEKEKITRDTREKRLARFRRMQSREVVDAGVIDEEEGLYRAAVAAVGAAEIGVKRAAADLKEKQASLEGSRAEVKWKESLVEVARRDRDRAQAMLDYSRVVAPFDGIVTQRNVDPGAFVQNATTSNSEALISVARTDIVTVVFNLPDYAAAYLNRGTTVEIQLDELPGVVICGKVTRFTPAIRGNDRSMRVEVDLFNGGDQKYRAFLGKAVACAFSSAMDSGIISIAPSAIGQTEWSANQKGANDPLPLCPEVTSSTELHQPLVAGMGGTARVQLREFDQICLLPTSAVFSMGGKTYIMELKDGKTRLVPVRVQVNDGQLAKVVVVGAAGRTRNGGEILRELTGEEMIVASRQLEIGEGQSIRATVEDW